MKCDSMHVALWLGITNLICTNPASKAGRVGQEEEVQEQNEGQEAVQTC